MKLEYIVIIVCLSVAVLTSAMSYVVISEINGCGGLAQCLGEFARDFDSARGGQ